MHYAIIAAGDGSRLVREGVSMPKPLLDLDGRPMIKRLIDIYVNQGAESVSVIVNESMPQVSEYLRSLQLPVPLHIVVKSTPSSMHSFYELARRMGHGRMICSTVDTVFRPFDFAAYATAFEADPEADGYMAVTDYIDDEKPLYVEVAADMRITAFRDEPWPGAKYVSGGIYGLGPRAAQVLAQCVERGVSRMRNYQRALVEAGLLLRAYPMGRIMDVDHAADIPLARAYIKG